MRRQWKLQLPLPSSSLLSICEEVKGDDMTSCHLFFFA
jgi:hypothetical protein